MKGGRGESPEQRERQDCAVRTCRAADLFDDRGMLALVAEYESECGSALLGKPGPRREVYEGMERTGLAQCFAAYARLDHPLDPPRLAGFACVLVAVVPHYGYSCATVESLFVSRDARASGLGSKLMEAVEAYAKGAGCTVMFYTAPIGSRLARQLFLRPTEYPNTNAVFARLLK